MGLVFLTDNRVLDANISMITGTVNSQFPLDNLKHNFTTKVFRSNEDVIEILLDLGVSTSIDAFAIVGSAVSGLACGDVEIYGSLSTDFTGVSAITIDVSTEHNFGFKLFTPVAARYWKVKCTNTGGDYVELSNIYLGAATNLTTNGFSIGSFEFKHEDNVSVSSNKYGQKFIDYYNKTKQMTGEIENCDESEMRIIRDVYLQHGKSVPLFFLGDSTGSIMTDGEYIYSGYFYLGNNLSWKHSAFNLYNLEIELEEVV